jgi:transcriptional regulator with XRE-family HTH domain
MADKPKQPSEGLLIKNARERANLSVRAAARRASMSEGRWRQIENGYQTPAKGEFYPVRGPDMTVARMARVVDVAPEELADSGRADAADKLRELNAPRPATAGQRDDFDLRIARLMADPKGRRILESVLDMYEESHPR